MRIGYAAVLLLFVRIGSYAQLNSTECNSMTVDDLSVFNSDVSSLTCLLNPNASSDHLVMILRAKQSNTSNSAGNWTLFFQKFAPILDEALDKYSKRSDPNILEAIGEVKLKNFTDNELYNATFIQLWFHTRLRPFLSSVSTNFLSKLTSRNFSCQTFQIVVEALNKQEGLMEESRKESVFTSFIKPFLSKKNQTDPGCVVNTFNSRIWLGKNFGRFSSFATINDLQTLNKNFDNMTVLDLLSSKQKAELILDSKKIGNVSYLQTVFGSVLMSSDLTELENFFVALNQTAKQMNMTSIPSVVSTTILNMSIESLVPNSQTISPNDVTQWLKIYLRLLIFGINPSALLNIPRNISCDLYKEIVKGLDSVRDNLSSASSNVIFNYSQDFLKNSAQGGKVSTCYTNGSYYVFLKEFFLGFGFPNLKTFLSLIPADNRTQLISTISTDELSEFLNNPNTLSNVSELCDLLKSYNKTKEYLTKNVSSTLLAQQTLECVWSQPLKASTKSEVDEWFDGTLVQYLPSLSSKQINYTQLNNASCLSYQKVVSILETNFNFSGTDFTQADVYSSIKAYLKSNDASPRCYNSSDNVLNSTSWFADNIGSFIPFITVGDMESFALNKMPSAFFNNSKNLQLFNDSTIPDSVVQSYTTQLHKQDPNFTLVRLPELLVCQAPLDMFQGITLENTTILANINKFCKKMSPEVTATLSAYFPNVSVDVIKSLGNQSVGLTLSKINSAPQNVFKDSLSTLSTVSGWDKGQANAIVQRVISEGFNISSASSLVTLGSLIGGVPSKTFSSINSTELLNLIDNPVFINNLQSAPVTLQEAFVQKIVFANQANMYQNVPDNLVTYIPPVLLASSYQTDLSLINKKRWNHDQALLLFGTAANTSNDTEALSDSVLQGFTCTSVQTLSVQKIKQLVKACRPRQGRGKVILKEHQLLCMYKYMKNESSLNYDEVPSDMLLYYSYSKVPKENCTAYFTALGKADFSVPSGDLGINTNLTNNAWSCLNISNGTLTKDQIEVLGNMTCTLNSSYINKSDPLIVEKLKTCPSLSDDQIGALLPLLSGGNTSYGHAKSDFLSLSSAPSTWNQQTLEDMGNLPLYFNQDVWAKISSGTKSMFLKSFFPKLRSQNTPINKLRTLFKACSAIVKTKRDTACTARGITSVTIANESFPVGYDSSQFDYCLSNDVLQENLVAITKKVVDSSFQGTILKRLAQIYPSGLADSVVQLLGSTSREATVDFIQKWNITTLDTLSSLIDLNNGDWTSEKSNTVIMRYLNVSGNTLGSSELNAIRSNLCSLNVSVLNTITAESLKTANTLNLSSCSVEKKSALYSIANISFSSQRSNPTTYYHLITPFLGGAPLKDIQQLSTLNISMDITTFMSLDPAVIKALNVATVKSLLGVNVADLKLFEKSSVIQSWVAEQQQSDLNSLNIWTGGKPTSPDSGGWRVHHAGGWFICLGVGLLTITLHTL